MSAATNPLSYNGYIQQMGILAVYTITQAAGVNQFVDAPISLSVPNMLNYAELRIQRDLDMLAAKTSTIYTLIPVNLAFDIPIDDFVTVETIDLLELSNGVTVNSTPLVPVSEEFIQNTYSGTASAGSPRFFAMIGSTFGDGGDVVNRVRLGPPPDDAYPIRVRGTFRMPSLFKYAIAPDADTKYNYISAYYPDLLTMASMIYITMLQRNFGAVGDSPEMGMTYEKQYQILRIGAIAEENRRKQMGSGWSAYSTPVSATPTR